MRRSSLVALALWLLAAQVEAAITFNADAKANTTAGNALSVSFGAGKPTAGDLVVVLTAVSFDAPNTPNVPTDNQSGNTYTLVGAIRDYDPFFCGVNCNHVAMYYAKNVNVSGTYTVTETPAGTCGGSCNISVILLAFSGVDTTSPFDVQTGQTQTSTSAPSTGAVTTLNANDVLVGVFAGDIGGETITKAAAYSESTNGRVNGASQQDLYTEYQIVAATASYSATWTSSSAIVALGAQFGSFKASGGAAAVVPLRTLLGVGK